MSIKNLTPVYLSDTQVRLLSSVDRALLDQAVSEGKAQKADERYIMTSTVFYELAPDQKVTRIKE